MRPSWAITLVCLQLIVTGTIVATQLDRDSEKNSEPTTLAKRVSLGHSDLSLDKPFSDEDLRGVMHQCNVHDCKRGYFFTEAFRWIKNAFVDIWEFISRSTIARTILFIGVSILVATIVGSNPAVALALQATGFGVERITRNTIAAVVQQYTGNGWIVSVIGQLQSAARDGASVTVIRALATTAFASLGTIGALEAQKFIEAGMKPSHQERYFRQLEWRTWEARSRVYTPDLKVEMARSSWGVPKGKRCVAYGYREYRAPILVVPYGHDPMRTCLQTPNAIRSIGFKTPLKCKDKGSAGIVGVWYVQSNETRCMPYWGHFEDEGCTQYGQRRMFARLHGLSLKDSWNGVCGSAPATIKGIRYGQPTYCEDKGVLGIYGVFNVPDDRCNCYCRHS